MSYYPPVGAPGKSYYVSWYRQVLKMMDVVQVVEIVVKVAAIFAVIVQNVLVRHAVVVSLVWNVVFVVLVAFYNMNKFNLEAITII